MIILIEDQCEIRSLITDYFTYLEKDVLAYASAEEAINDFERLEKLNISTIISDYSLPGMHGIDFIEHARDVLKPLVCMLISGHLPPHIPENIVVVPKPFRPSALLQTMNIHLEKLSANTA